MDCLSLFFYVCVGLGWRIRDGDGFTEHSLISIVWMVNMCLFFIHKDQTQSQLALASLFFFCLRERKQSALPPSVAWWDTWA